MNDPNRAVHNRDVITGKGKMMEKALYTCIICGLAICTSAVIALIVTMF